MWATIEKRNRRVYPAIISILHICLDNTPLYTLRVLCFFEHNSTRYTIHQTALDVNKNIFPYKSQVIKANRVPLPLRESRFDNSLSLSARLIPFMGPFQEAGPCFIDSIMKHLNIKRMPTCSQQVASMNRSQLYLWKSSKKNNTFESPDSKVWRKILIDEVQKIERNGGVHLFILEGCYCNDYSDAVRYIVQLWKWLFPSFQEGGGCKLA